jgi:formate-dependent nitrite reductase membrane component NrfD
VTGDGAGRRDARRKDAGDGRNIDGEIGTLAGEAAGQAVPADRAEAQGAAPFAVWEKVPTQRTREPGDITYYDRPVLKEPVWIWAVPMYFFVGSTAGAAAVLGAAAQITGDQDLRDLVMRCRRIAAAGDAIGAGLLVYDLGRPARFLNMLRVFRPTSPMSVGSWVLAVSAPLSATSLALARSDGSLGALGDVAGVGAGIAGMPLTGYTAVLLSNTAVPIWQATRRSLPVLFTASGMSSAASLLELMDLTEREERVVRRFGVLGKLAEMGAMLAVERDARMVERVGRPLRDGVSGALWKAARGLTAASLTLSLLPGRSRGKRTASALLGAAGSLAVRFAVFHAGKASARDPRATFQQQRQGRGAAEVTGVAALTGPGDRRAVPRAGSSSASPKGSLLRE